MWFFISCVYGVNSDNKKGFVNCGQCSSPSVFEILKEKETNFTVLFWPTNVTSLIQTVDHRVIELMKRIYQKIFMCKLLLSNNAEGVIKRYKQQHLKSYTFMHVEVWENVHVVTSNISWKNLYSYEITDLNN